MTECILKMDCVFGHSNTRTHDAPALNWPHLSIDRFMQFVPYLGPTLWNDLPALKYKYLYFSSKVTL